MAETIPLCKPRASGGTAYEVDTRQTWFPDHFGVRSFSSPRDLNCRRLPDDREPHRGCVGSYFTMYVCRLQSRTRRDARRSEQGSFVKPGKHAWAAGGQRRTESWPRVIGSS